MSRELLGQFDLFSSSEIKRTKVCSRCKQRLDVENFYHNKGRFNSFCIKCAKKYQNEYTKDNKKTINRKYQEMCSTEEGAIRVMFRSIKNKINSKKRSVKKGKLKMTEKEIYQYYECKVTYEELLEIWKEQHKKYGMHCPISKQIMTFLRANNGKRGPGNAFSNTISIDRLDPNVCYQKNNIIFIANEVNLRKNKVYYNDCVRIIELHKEKFPERFQ